MGLADPTTMGFAHMGDDIRLFELARITNPENISLGSHVLVDDFVFIQGGRGVSIESYVHFAAFSCLMGGGEAVIGACSGIAAGARVLSGTDLADGSGLLGPLIPAEFRAVWRGRTVVEK